MNDFKMHKYIKYSEIDKHIFLSINSKFKSFQIIFSLCQNLENSLMSKKLRTQSVLHVTESMQQRHKNFHQSDDYWHFINNNKLIPVTNHSTYDIHFISLYHIRCCLYITRVISYEEKLVRRPFYMFIVSLSYFSVFV